MCFADGLLPDRNVLEHSPRSPQAPGVLRQQGTLVSSCV